MLESELVSSAMPNVILHPDDLQADLDEIDEMVEAEASAPLEGYDPDTTSWAMQSMGVSAAWKAGFKGSELITIAVVDSGYTAHTDVNSACIDMTRAANVYYPIDLDNDIYQTDVTDVYGHGTFVTGQICASLNNTGVNGVCRNIKIVPIKISDPNNTSENTSWTYLQVRALSYAKKIGADIVNMSWEITGGYSNFEAIGYEGLFVCSAGNNGFELTTSSSTNSAKANDNSKWIVVGNMTEQYTCATSSNYSATYVDIFAPGDDIHGLDNDGSGYTDKGGTSMASPHVAAAAALIMSHATHLTEIQVRQLLIDKAVVTTALTGKCVANGYLSISRVVSELYGMSRPSYSRGDANGDGIVDVVDYMMTKRIVLGTFTATADQMQGADASGDGEVNLIDYMMLKRYTLRTHYFSPV